MSPQEVREYPTQVRNTGHSYLISYNYNKDCKIDSPKDLSLRVNKKKYLGNEFTPTPVYEIIKFSNYGKGNRLLRVEGSTTVTMMKFRQRDVDGTT